MNFSTTEDWLKELRKTSFLITSALASGFPAPEVPELMFSGRSNAGKSSVLNAICDQKRLAKTAKAPGKTSNINFFKTTLGLHLVDVPGYGFATASKVEKSRWERLIRSYLQKRLTLCGVVLIMDIRHPLSPSDLLMLDMTSTLKVPFCLLLNKVDKLSSSSAKRSFLQVQKEIQKSYPKVSFEIIPFSAKSPSKEQKHALAQWMMTSSSW